LRQSDSRKILKTRKGVVDEKRFGLDSRWFGGYKRHLTPAGSQAGIHFSNNLKPRPELSSARKFGKIVHSKFFWEA